MYCPKCGAMMEDNAKFCTNCGAKNENAAEKIVNDVKAGFDNAEKELGSSMNDVKDKFTGNKNPQGGSEALKTDRSLVSYILLSIITCGIYGYYFIYQMAHDVNIACEGDGETTGGVVAFVILSFITLGIYAWVWDYKIGNRLASNAPRYGLTFQENGTTVILWCLFGSLICGIGPYIAAHILIKNTNAICLAYNKEHGLI